MAYNRKEEYLAVIKQPKEISNSLLETIDYIAQARDAELSFDKTIVAEIVSLNNADTGEYFVEYQKGKFRAYTPSNLSYVYEKGTNVYVKIPGGDFTQKKIIEGKVSASSFTEDEYTALTQQIIGMGEVYHNDEEFGILAYAQEGTEYYEKVIYENENSEVDTTFSSLLTTYPHIMISADFKTNFYGTMAAGNYGLKIELQEKDTNIIYNRRLDIVNFSGSIYSYDTYSPQYAIYDLSGLDLSRIIKITFFQERFLRYDTVFDAYENPIIIYDKDPNIFVKNISIKFIDLQDSSKNLYYVGISAPQGLSLIQDTDRIKLKGVLYYASKDIMDTKNCVCYWYKQNPAILSGDEKYDTLAGSGWEAITDNVDFNEIVITGKEVYQQMRYKLIVVYNSSITLSKDIRVVKYYNERFTIIRKDVSDTEVKLTIVDSHEAVNEADWYVDLKDGSYLPLETGVAEIDITKYLNYSDIMFYTVSTLEDGRTIPCEYNLKTYQQDSPVRVVFAGNDTFQYDKNGSISYDQSITEFIIKPTITVNKENIGVKTITWYSPDGGELLEYPTTKITNSMISKLWVDKDTNSLHYNIRQKYISSYSNNTLQLKIITLSDKEFYFNKTIVFTKQGDYDLNGLDYSFYVKQCDESGNEIKSQPLNRKNAKSEYTAIYFKPELRLNSQTITNDSKYTDSDGVVLGTYNIAVKAKAINLTSELFNSKDNIYKISNAVDDCDGQYFIKFSIAIGLNKHEDVEKKVLHYYQPVMVSQGFDVSKIETITIPSRIVYDSSGTPSYNSSTPISFTYKNNRNSETDLVNNSTKSLTKNLFIYSTGSYSFFKTFDGGYYLRPIDNYEGAYFAETTDDVKTKPMGALKIFLTTRSYLFYPIVMLNGKTDNITNVENDATIQSVVNDLNVEKTSPIQVNLDAGKVNSGRTTIGDIIEVFNESEEKKTNGLFQYNEDGVPTNTLRSNGIVHLGGDKFVIDENGVSVNGYSIMTSGNFIQWLKDNKETIKEILDL